MYLVWSCFIFFAIYGTCSIHLIRAKGIQPAGDLCGICDKNQKRGFANFSRTTVIKKLADSNDRKWREEEWNPKRKETLIELIANVLSRAQLFLVEVCVLHSLCRLLLDSWMSFLSASLSIKILILFLPFSFLTDPKFVWGSEGKSRTGRGDFSHVPFSS